jgi:hypothetical protein
MLPKSSVRIGDWTNVTGPEPWQPVKWESASGAVVGEAGVVGEGALGLVGVEDEGGEVVGPGDEAQPASNKAIVRSAARMRTHAAASA